MVQYYRSRDKKTTNLTENVKAKPRQFSLNPAKPFNETERMLGKILVAPPSEKPILEMARALEVDKKELLKAAEKVDLKVAEYVAHELRAAGFLRMAIEQE